VQQGINDYNLIIIIIIINKVTITTSLLLRAGRALLLEMQI
jgi:hypothetical protein